MISITETLTLEFYVEVLREYLNSTYIKLKGVELHPDQVEV